MKKSKLVFISGLLTVAFLSCNAEPQEANGSDILSIIDRFYPTNLLEIQLPEPTIVSKFKIKSIEFKVNNLEVVSSTLSHRNDKILKYDEKGYLIKRQEFDKNGKEKRMYEFEYFFENNKLKAKTTNEIQNGFTNNIIKSSEKYSYDKSGSLIETTTYIGQNCDMAFSKTNYNINGDETEIVSKRIENDQMLKNNNDSEQLPIYRYTTKNGKPIEMIYILKSKPNVEQKNITKGTYIYNNNKLIKYTASDMQNPESKTIYEYKYNKEGLIEELTLSMTFVYKGKQNNQKSTTNIFYNEKGLPIKIETNNVEKNLSASYSFNYEYFN